MVKHLLETNPQTRNSDHLLYLQVIQHEAHIKGVNLHVLSVADFLASMNSLGFTGFETVRRARQKIQAQFPKLAASGRVSAARAEKEKNYRAFAGGEV